ncbi:MAG: hypothetical protein EOP85_00500 [Verrucomicrobiaceae bacterium]|nr:MAG: hypothetical protein EOP85_00500 [Verrucomicrobiaceae bacterium]
MNFRPSITLLLTHCVLLMSAGLLPGHVFTNPDGKTFEGEVVNGNEKTVTIERSSDKKAFTIDRSRLSEADQAYVTQWISDNPNVRLSIRTAKKSEKEEGGTKASTTTLDRYQIEIRNESAEATPEFTLRYLLRQTQRNSDVTGTTSSTMYGEVDVLTIPSIPAFRSVSIPTRSVKNVTTTIENTSVSDLADGRVRIDRQSSKSKSSLNGISLLVYHKERKVARYAMVGMEKYTEELLRAGNSPAAAP